MDSVNFTNLVMYVVIGILSLLLIRKGEYVTGIALGTLALHGLIFNGVYIYRDQTMETCPPVCGLQHWSSVLRLHGLVAIVTSMLYRLFVKRYIVV
jgi:hypothetical protein